jgi:hypothetical protein
MFEELKPDRWQILLTAARSVLAAADIRTTPEAGVVRWVCPWGELVKMREAVECFADGFMLAKTIDHADTIAKLQAENAALRAVLREYVYPVAYHVDPALLHERALALLGDK